MFEPSLIVDHIIFILGWLPISSGVELHCGIIGTTLSSLSPDFWKAPQSWRWVLFSMAVDNFFSKIPSFDLFSVVSVGGVHESWLYVFLWSFPWFPELDKMSSSSFFLQVANLKFWLRLTYGLTVAVFARLRFGTTGELLGAIREPPLKTQYSAESCSAVEVAKNCKNMYTYLEHKMIIF